MNRPSAEMLGCARNGTPLVIGSGSPSLLPDPSSIGIRQRFALPARSLTKYRYRPSGDQTGLQSMG